MGNQNNIQTWNPGIKNNKNLNQKRRNIVNDNSKLSHYLKNKKNLVVFLIKVENWIVLQNLNL